MTGVVVASNGCRGGKRAKREAERQSQLSVIALLMATLRKSMVNCRMSFGEEQVLSAAEKLEIGWPTEVRHVAHVTFDRFNGFLGLPVEFELEFPCRAPSASVSVFGVSADSMQCGFDPKGNSVPTILLLMQERLYSQGGLKAEGIFRINPENSEEKDLRTQLNNGIIPDDIDVHCLAALIKAWFRELPKGILDSLSPGQVLQCETEEDCVGLVKLLPATQLSLLDWAVDLMADVVEEEELNKMNARNIAMVFAPNMTQLSDPLTSLMHAVQVMNLLQTLIFRTLRERDDAAAMEGYSLFSSSCTSEGDMDDESGDLMSENRPDCYEEDEIVEECFLKQLELNSMEDREELICARSSSGDQETEAGRSGSNTPEVDPGCSSTTTSRVVCPILSLEVVVSDVNPSDEIDYYDVVEMAAEVIDLSEAKLSDGIEDGEK